MRHFLALFQQSQMFEMMIQERLEMANQFNYYDGDAFEHKISLVEHHESKRLSGIKTPVMNLSKSLSLRRSKRRLMVSTSDNSRMGIPSVMVSISFAYSSSTAV